MILTAISILINTSNRFVNLLMRDRPVTLHGNGLNTRNFLYVRLDCLT